MYIQPLCAFNQAKVVPRGQYMGYELSENMVWRILGEALPVPGRSLGGLQRGLAGIWEPLGSVKVPGRFAVVFRSSWRGSGCPWRFPEGPQ